MIIRDDDLFFEHAHTVCKASWNFHSTASVLVDGANTGVGWGGREREKLSLFGLAGSSITEADKVLIVRTGSYFYRPFSLSM